MPEVSTHQKYLDMQASDLAAIKRDEALTRLKANPDFQSLILQHYMVDNCAHHAHNAAVLGWSPEKRADAIAAATAPGHLVNYMMAIEHAAGVALGRQAELAEALHATSEEGGQ